MGNTPKVSVIIPTHNRPERLKTAIQSVQKQTFSNWELIVVPDHCEESTFEVLRTFNDPRIVVIANDGDRRGGAAARNIGMDAAKGEFFAFLDDDDEWLPRKLELQLGEFVDYPRAVLVSCDSYAISSNGKSRRSRPTHIHNSDLQYENVPGSYSFVMIRRTDLRISESLKAFQDWDLWLKLTAPADSVMRSVDQPLAVFNVHQEGRVSDFNSSKLEAYQMFLSLHHWTRKAEKYHRAKAIYYQLKQPNLNILQRFSKVCRYWLTRIGSGRKVSISEIKSLAGRLIRP